MESEKQRQAGFEEVPLEAINTLELDIPFTKQDFEDALSRVFPFTQVLQDEQESSKT